ncbi:unnamed protein product [Tilletia controversa]|uniref:tRNA N(3)-methylcytidine methyltransferase n=3 Tax=Tilletia TaxID=13289 RepID=A0A8X7N077_9BASI|nr:hypothetical protein CF336_g2537 [Tilletia laevis]KAE8197678.1 hypothetical protein CF328_g3781 [Tilletia controversa]KAE8261099.1 hypothetical protein A4X03_0g3545 [Tilletia caries]KAE8207245.1 hypothetical protein CF335_g1284 [Tilletia laevis]KAE8254057.1 hypothetical protein A4X06_0g1095 [Tilletia controversa]
MAPATKAETEAHPEQLVTQNRRIASEFAIVKVEAETQKSWDTFYKRNETKFFKDRHWTDSEFSELKANNPSNAAADGAQKPSGSQEQTTAVEELEPGIISSAPDSRPPVLLEVGCGVGNTVYPLIEKSDVLKVHCCDFSPRAVDFVKLHSLYTPERVHAFVHDLATPEEALHSIVAKHPIGPPTVITMFFVLSAIPPEYHLNVLKALAQCLRLSGEESQHENVLLFRDYGHLDLAQVRFHVRADASYRDPALLSDDHPYYRRGDGTLTYFFEEERLKKLAEEAGLEGPVEVIVKVKVNRKLESKMERRFIQARWRLRKA